MKNVSVITHPIAKLALSHLRDRELTHDKFRFHSDALCKILVAETALELENEDNLIVIPILRAGLAMLNAVLQEFPQVKVGFVGLARDEDTAMAKEYYWKIPEFSKDSTIILLDPMLATGGSVTHVLEKLHQPKLKEIHLISAIASPEGIDKVHTAFPEIKIHTASVDDGLDARKYIVPGLGDYGDRYFGTE